MWISSSYLLTKKFCQERNHADGMVGGIPPFRAIASIADWARLAQRANWLSSERDNRAEVVLVERRHMSKRKLASREPKSNSWLC